MMKKIYDLLLKERKSGRIILADSWGVVTDDGRVTEIEAEAMEQLGRRLIGEARGRRRREIKAA